MTQRAIDPKVSTLLQTLQQQGTPPVQSMTPVEARRTRNRTLRNLNGPSEAVSRLENRVIPGPGGDLPIRIYAPDGKGPFPVLVFFHGGGYVIGNLNTHDGPCRSIANQTPCLVVSVDYRLAPEHRFPAAADDAYAATCWVAGHAEGIGADANRIAVAGDSAGGNLAAVVCLMAKENDYPSIEHQTLIYPITDLSSVDTASYREHAVGYMLTLEGMIYYRDHYLGKADDGMHPYASPLLADDLSGLPPALVIAAEFDVLKDEGKAYADRLKHAGVKVHYILYKDMIHAFFNLGSVTDRTREAIGEIALALRTVF